MHLLSVKLVALMSLAAVRLSRIRVPIWHLQFSLWRLRLEHPTELRELPLTPWGQMFFAWIFQPIAVAMAMMVGRVRYDLAGLPALTLGSLDAKRNLRELAADGYAETIEDMRPLAAKFAAWMEPFGKETDMQSRTKADAVADTLTAIFSLAAINHGHLTTPIADFHRLMVALRKEFPDEMPSFDEVGRPPFQSSELLSDALHRAINDRRILLDSRKDLHVDAETAMRNMNAFDRFSRQRFVMKFSRVAARFVALQRAADDGPFGPPDIA